MIDTSRQREPRLYSETREEASDVSSEPPRAVVGRPFSFSRWAVIALSIMVLLFVGGAIASLVLGPGGSMPSSDAITPVAPSPAAAVAGPNNSAGYKSQAIGDWFLVCAEPPAISSCIAQQQLIDASKSVIFTWSLQRDSNGVLHTLWHIPPDAEPSRGFIIDAGDGRPRPVRFGACDDQGCSIAGILAPDFVDTLQRASTIVAAYVSSSTGKAIRIPLSSRGLPDVLLRLTPPPLPDNAAR
jgi:invasion protein IalB